MSDHPTLGVSNFLLENGCPSPKLHPTCIFNHFLRPLAARSDDATLQLQRSQSQVRTPAAAWGCVLAAMEREKGKKGPPALASEHRAA